MKKHIFGFMLFGLIVASFAFVYAFFNAPSIPSREAVKPPITQTEPREEKPYYCNLRRNKVSYEVLSSQYFSDQNEVVSKIKITWDGGNQIPEKVYLNTDFITLGGGIKYLFEDKQILDSPFKVSNEFIANVTYKVPLGKRIYEKENLYAFFNVSQSLPIGKGQRSSADARQVLFVHGENSVIRNTDSRNK